MFERLLSTAQLPGRALLCAIFLLSGVHKIMAWPATAENMRSEGMVAVPLFLAGAIVFEIGGGLSLFLGWKGRLGALALIVFLIPTTFIFHDFWNYDEPAAAQSQMQHFMKNLAILGGLFVVLGAGSGCCSIDAWRRRRRTAARES